MQPRRDANCSIARTLLLVANVGMLCVGGFLLFFTLRLKRSGWLDALYDSEYDFVAHDIVWMLKLLGSIVICLAFIGGMGAFFRQRCLLLIYAIALTLAMVVLLLLTIFAFSLSHEMKTWQQKDFPAVQDETTVGEKFNMIYCYALGGYFCNILSARQALDIFLPEAPQELISKVDQIDGKGINSLCTDNSTTDSIPGLDQVCKACGVAKQYSDYDKVLQWAQDKCPATSDTTLWCGEFLVTSKQGPVYEDSPYRECRSKFLDIARTWSNRIAWVACINTALSLVLVCASISLRRKRKRCDQEMGMHYQCV